MKIKAFPVYTGQSGCDFHRIRLPFIYGGEYYDNDAYKGFQVQKMLEFMAISEVVVYNRSFPLGVERIKELRDKNGFKVVVDLDDWVLLPDYHPNYKQYKSYASKEIIENIKMANCVTVTTNRLYNKVKDYNSNVHVIPNALPFGHGQFVSKPDLDNENFNFIYTGQSSHLEDVRLMEAQMNKVAKLPNISFSLAGYKEHEVWRKIEKVFSVVPNYIRIESIALDKYMTVYDNADCLVVPLCSNGFNIHKSNLKLLEAAAKKIPAIVSHVAPYNDDKEAPVLWVKEPKDWYKHIKYLSENREVAKDMGQQLLEWANERFNLTYWNRVRFELYKSLI